MAPKHATALAFAAAVAALLSVAAGQLRPPIQQPDGTACATACGDNQQCVRGSCVCNKNFVNVSGVCQQGLGASCENNQPCIEGLGDYAICKNRRCACNEESVAVDHTCYIKQDLGEACAFPQQCAANDSICRNGYCSCKDGMVESKLHDSNYCISVVNTYRGACNASSQCQGGTLGTHSKCDSKQCSCENEYYYDDPARKCLHKKTLDEHCDVAHFTGCYLEKDGDKQHIECKGGVCKCKTGYATLSDRKSCVQNGAASRTQLSALTLLLLFIAYVMKQLK